MATDAPASTLRDQPLIADDEACAAVRGGLRGQVVTGSFGQRYTIGPLRSEGGQGWIFLATAAPNPARLPPRARRAQAGETVVVKVLRFDALAAEDGKLRFHREAQVLRALSEEPAPSPRVVRFYDYAEHRLAITMDGAEHQVQLPFTVLEHVPGTSLDQELAHGALQPSLVRTLVADVVAALEYVHARGVVHRDLKPANILLAPDGSSLRAKLTDFGLVRIVTADWERTARLAGASVGYAPPEQYERGNERVSPRTDVFSLAAVVFEMLSGQQVFPYQPGEAVLPVITKILNGRHPPLTLPAGSPLEPVRAALEAELHRALAPEPSARHASVAELHLALERIWGTAQAAAPEPTRSWLVRSTQPRATEQRWKAAVFGPRGRHALALGERSIDLVSATEISPQQAPAQMPFAQLESFSRTPSGSLLLVGQAGLCGKLSSDLLEFQLFPRAQRARTLRGALLQQDGRLVAFGSAHDNRALLAFYTGVGSGEAPHLSRELVLDLPELLCGAQGPQGQLWFGARGGHLLQLTEHGPNVISVCQANLNAIAYGRDELLVVGNGGHVVRVDLHTPSPQPSIERVQTTRDLHALVVVGEHAWVAGDGGRLLVRERQSWRRVELGGDERQEARPLALHVGLALGATSTNPQDVGHEAQIVIEALWSDGTFSRGSNV